MSPPNSHASGAHTSDAVLQARDLGVIRAADGLPLVSGVDLCVHSGEVVALVGESGCGKSLTSLAVVGLLPRGVETAASTLLRMGDQTPRTEAAWRDVRGRWIGYVHQDPMSALNPVQRIGSQIADGARHPGGLSAQDARKLAMELLAEFELDPPARFAASFPHELSGGQRQRVALAAALAPGPRVLIADEPTTALDPTVQWRLLRLIRQRVDARGLAVLLVTHDLDAVERIADRVVVMYAGRIAEMCTSAEFFHRPRHPYSAALLAARPHRGRAPAPIPGRVPAPDAWGTGCRFAERCGLVRPDCRITAPTLEPADPAAARRLACPVVSDEGSP